METDELFEVLSRCVNLARNTGDVTGDEASDLHEFLGDLRGLVDREGGQF